MLKRPEQTAVHGADAFAGMRHAGRFTAEMLDYIGTHVRPGMFFTIEPMLNAGRPEAKILADG